MLIRHCGEDNSVLGLSLPLLPPPQLALRVPEERVGSAAVELGGVQRGVVSFQRFNAAVHGVRAAPSLPVLLPLYPQQRADGAAAEGRPLA